MPTGEGIVSGGSMELASTGPPFRNRADAAESLALALSMFATTPDVTVLGVARGGVPIARQVASALGASLGVVVSRKIGVPGIEEVALGAIAEGSDRIAADPVSWYIGVPPRVVKRLAARARLELARRVQFYRAGRPLPAIRDRTVILVDDGLATGATLRAAARAVRKGHPRHLIAAVPVASQAALDEMRREVDEVVAVFTRTEFTTVSASYEDFSPVTDEEVLNLLRPTRLITTDERLSTILRDVSDRIAPPWSCEGDAYRDGELTIAIPVRAGAIMADLGMPQRGSRGGDAEALEPSRGLAILAHGGGSSRDSYRNRYLAGRLRLSGYTTLRVDLLTATEQDADDEHASMRFDVARLSARLTRVCDWAAREGVAGAERTILIGASTGAAAALTTAAQRRGRVFAVVARGGRVDLAAEHLARVWAPVLLIVGAADAETLEHNSEAMRVLGGGGQLTKVPRAGHTFDEPGALGAVAEHMVKWLDRLTRRVPRGSALRT
jgi:putative phosphoribosyl transferase